MSLLEECLTKPETKILLELLHKANMDAYIHAYNVGELVEKMLNHTHGFDDKKESIVTGALLHDIGKAFVPLNLTQLPARLTHNERYIVQLHAALSYEVVSPAYDEIVHNICLLHHERINGSGYPNGCPMLEIPDYVLLVQVADIYDALTSDRPYKQSYSSDEALEIMRKESKVLKLDDSYFELLKQAIAE